MRGGAGVSQFDSLTVPGLSDDEQATLNRLVKQLKEREPRNLLRQRLYDNQEVARRIGDTIPAAYFNMGIVLGWTGKAVDALGRRCTLERFVWADGDLESLGARKVWDDNNLRSEINSAKVSSASRLSSSNPGSDMSIMCASASFANRLPVVRGSAVRVTCSRSNFSF